MIESQFKLTAPKLLERLNILLERINRYISDIEVKESEITKSKTSFNLFSLALQEPRAERVRLVELHRAVSTQIDICKGFEVWDSTILLTKSDLNLIFKWTHQYLNSKNTIETIEKHQ